MSTLLEKHYAVLVSEHKTLKRSYGQLNGSFKRLKAKVSGLRKAAKYSQEDVNLKVRHYERKNEELARSNSELHSKLRKANAKLRAAGIAHD